LLPPFEYPPPMKSFAALVPVALTILVQSEASAIYETHPIQRVIGMLEDLKDKVTYEAENEEITYAKFGTWCSDSERSLQAVIVKEKSTIDSLESEVAAKKEETSGLKEQIAQLENELLQHESSAAAADDERKEAAGIYSQTDKDLEATIKAIAEAITALEDAESKATTSLVQVKIRSLMKLPLLLEQLTEAQQAQLLFNTQDAAAAAPLLAGGDYAAHVERYSFKSNNVIELLKELKAKFENDRLEATKAETNSQNAYNLAKKARDNAVQAAQATKDGKTSLLSDTEAALNSAESSLKTTNDDLQADTATLAQTKRSCEMKQSEWAERTNIRKQELKAMQAAIEILAEVSGVSTKAPSNPVLPPSPLKSESGETTTALPAFFFQVIDPKQRVINLLRAEAKKTHSRIFEQFAEQVASRINAPFGVIDNMIQKMIFRLMAEQKDEDDHKNWCDLELEKTNSSKVNKEEKVKMLDDKLTDTKATLNTLSSDVVTAEQMIATIDSHLTQAADIRQAGKDENKAAAKDAKDAQIAITKAIAVLQAFYKDSGMIAKEPWEFLQRGVVLPDQPETWSSSYTGILDPQKQPQGVITVLKETSANFAKMEADTEAQENLDQKAYEEEVKRCQIEKARRSKEAEMKKEEKQRLLAKAAALQQSQKHVNDELGAVNQYLKDLSPACLDGDSTFEDRKAARTKEIEALSEAQQILVNAFKASAPASAPSGAAAFLAPVNRMQHN